MKQKLVVAREMLNGSNIFMDTNVDKLTTLRFVEVYIENEGRKFSFTKTYTNGSAGRPTVDPLSDQTAAQYFKL